MQYLAFMGSAGAARSGVEQQVGQVRLLLHCANKAQRSTHVLSRGADSPSST